MYLNNETLINVLPTSLLRDIQYVIMFSKIKYLLELVINKNMFIHKHI